MRRGEHEVDFSAVASNILMRVLHLKTQDRETTPFVPGNIDFLAKIAALPPRRKIEDSLEALFKEGFRGMNF